jgi:hypothetical protein
MGNDVLSAGFFLMIMGSFYTFFKDLFVRYYYEIQSWFYVSVEVQEGDDTYKWLSGMFVDFVFSDPNFTSLSSLSYFSLLRLMPQPA